MDNLLFAFGLTVLAGLATGAGSVLAFFTKRDNGRFLAIAMGFSAGVMLYVSFVEIIPKAEAALAQVYGPRGYMLAVLSFFAGIIVTGLIDRLVPSAENPHETRDRSELADLKVAHPPRRAHLFRTGLITSLAITIHNFPEGLATFVAALEDPQLGIMLAVAIALHNIPEGVSVSVPIYYATGSRARAFVISFLSGLAEPVGALIGYAILRPVLSPVVMGGLFGGVAGVMVFISVDELIPTARANGKEHDSIYGLVAGMAVMAATLVMMR